MKIKLYVTYIYTVLIVYGNFLIIFIFTANGRIHLNSKGSYVVAEDIEDHEEEGGCPFPCSKEFFSCQVNKIFIFSFQIARFFNYIFIMLNIKE